MNAHTRKSKLKSVLHYRDQNVQMNEAIQINSNTIKSLLDEFVECCPFKKDDIFFYDQVVYKVDVIREARVNKEGNLSFLIFAFLPNGRGFASNTSTLELRFDDIEDIKILHTTDETNS